MLYVLFNEMLWWHWVTIGLALLIAEIFTGTFILLGIGIGAIGVGILDIILNLSFALELVLLILISVGVIYLLFKYFKSDEVDSSGQSDYAIGVKGVVQEAISAHGRGKVKFNRPILGNTVWLATAEEDISISTEVKIVVVKGQLIEVEKV
jgi:membrane protein implicated in regulation of membrane protease activity